MNTYSRNTRDTQITEFIKESVAEFVLGEKNLTNETPNIQRGKVIGVHYGKALAFCELNAKMGLKSAALARDTLIQIANAITVDPHPRGARGEALDMVMPRKPDTSPNVAFYPTSTQPEDKGGE